jgi:hypothetical protein
MIKHSIEEIKRDIPRTYIVNNLNEVAENELFNILVAVAWTQSNIGYCQGMNFLAGALLLVTDDEETAFWITLGLIRKFDLEKLFAPGVPDLYLRTY